MIEGGHREGSLVSPHAHLVVPGEPSKPDGASVDRRISPELVFLENVEGQDRDLVARGGKALAELPAPNLGASHRGWIPLDEVQNLQGINSWYTVTRSRRFRRGSSRTAFTEERVERSNGPLQKSSGADAISSTTKLALVSQSYWTATSVEACDGAL